MPMVDYTIGLPLKIRAWMEALRKEKDIELSELVRSILASELPQLLYPAKAGPVLTGVLEKRAEELEELAEFAEGIHIAPELALFFAQAATRAYREMMPSYLEPRRKRLKRLSVKLPVFLRNIIFVTCRRKGQAEDARDPDFTDYSDEELFGLREKSDPQEIVVAAVEAWERTHIYGQDKEMADICGAIEFTGRGFRVLQT